MELGAEQVAIAAGDIRDEQQVIASIGALLDELGDVDALVNVAGISRPTRTLDTSLEEWENVFAVNSRGTFLATRATRCRDRRLDPSMTNSPDARNPQRASSCSIALARVAGGQRREAVEQRRDDRRIKHEHQQLERHPREPRIQPPQAPAPRISHSTSNASGRPSTAPTAMPFARSPSHRPSSCG